MPFNIIFGDEQYRDRIDLTIGAFFKKVKETGIIPKTAKEIADYFKHKPRQQGIFMLDTFEFLRKDGRISYAQSVVGGLLNIKPILKYDEEGKLVPWDKEKGTKKAFQKIANYVKENRTDDYLMISHADNEKGAKELAAVIEATLGEKSFIIAPMGAVIGTHTGPGCLFVSY